VASFRRILVIRSGAIGDFIVTLPVISLLRKEYRRAYIVVVAKNRLRTLVKPVAAAATGHGPTQECLAGAQQKQDSGRKNPLDDFIDIDAPLLVPFFQDEVDRSCHEFRYLAGFDLIISYLGTRGKFGENLRLLRETRVINADPIPPEDYHRPVTEFLLEPLAEILDVSCPAIPSITIGEEEADFARRFLSEHGIPPRARTIAVHPGSGGRRKVCAARNFCRAANWIVERFPETGLLLIEGEADKQDVRAVEQGLKAECVRVRRDDLLEVAAILSRTSLFMGNDSGIAHLAAAVGVPTIVVFRASNPEVWAPRGKQVWVAGDHSLQAVVEEVASKLLCSAAEA